MTKLQEAQAKSTLLDSQVADLLKKVESPEFTKADREALKAKNEELKAITAEITDLKEIEKIADEQLQRSADAREIDKSHRPSSYAGSGEGGGDNEGDEERSIVKSVTIPAVCKGVTPRKLMSISGVGREEGQKVAIALCQYLRAILNPNEEVRKKASAWCTRNGVVLRAGQAENSNVLGGVLVPIELAGYIISLMEQFGLCRQYFRVQKMAGDTMTVPRRAGTINAAWLVDGQTITASTKAWDMITLSAKKLGALVYYSNEIADDAMVDIGDDLAQEIAWAFSAMEDEAAFLGDGTSTYGGVVGLVKAFTTAFPTVTTTSKGGLVVGAAGSGAAWSSLVMGDFNNVKSATPAYVWKRGTCRWFCSQQFYYGEMERLAAAAGGNTILSIMRGNDGGPLFLGCEVVFVQVMPALRTANSQIVCYFGDPYLSSTLGDRKQLAIATSSEIGFASDQLAVRGITRLDINNHDVGGNNAATLAQNPAYDQTGGTYYGGPLVALQTYNS